MVGESKHILKQNKTQLNHGASKQCLKIGENKRKKQSRKHSM